MPLQLCSLSHSPSYLLSSAPASSLSPRLHPTSPHARPRPQSAPTCPPAHQHAHPPALAASPPARPPARPAPTFSRVSQMRMVWSVEQEAKTVSSLGLH